MNGEDLLQGFGEIAPEFRDDMQLLRMEKSAGQPLRKGWSKMKKTILGIAVGTAVAAVFAASISGSRFTGKDPASLPPEESLDYYTLAEEKQEEVMTERYDGDSAQETAAPTEEETPETAGTGDKGSQPVLAILAETSRNLGHDDLQHLQQG